MCLPSDGGLLKTVEIAQQVDPFDNEAMALARIGQLFLQHQGKRSLTPSCTGCWRWGDPSSLGRGRKAGVPSNLPIDGHSFRRVEILTGTPRRRRWSAAEKAAIVTKSFAPGAVTSTIALRHGLHRNQLYAWRREFRSAVVADCGVPVPDFVPVIAERQVVSGTVAIEIAVGEARR
jgi:transposase